MKYLRCGKKQTLSLLILITAMSFGFPRGAIDDEQVFDRPDFSRIISFYKTNPSDSYKVLGYNGATVIYRMSAGVPREIRIEDFNWSDDVVINFDMADGNSGKVQWKDFFLYCHTNTYEPPKGSRVMLGVFRHNRGNNRMEFLSSSGGRGTVSSRPVAAADNLEIRDNSVSLVECTLERIANSPGGKDQEKIIINRIWYAE